MIGRTRDPNKAEVGDVRATNLAVVLRCVREQGPCSRADIAAATGLNKTTVSSLVSELLRRRLLRETGTTENRVGRPAIMLALDGASSAAIGIEVNADYQPPKGTPTARNEMGELFLPLEGVIDVVAGGINTCLRLKTGQVQCMGYNVYGSDGDGTRIERATPVDVVGLP